MSATKDNQRDSSEEDRKLEGGVLRQDTAPPAPQSKGLPPAVYIGCVQLVWLGADSNEPTSLLRREDLWNANSWCFAAAVSGSPAAPVSLSSTSGFWQRPSSVSWWCSLTSETNTCLVSCLPFCDRYKFADIACHHTDFRKTSPFRPARLPRASIDLI